MTAPRIIPADEADGLMRVSDAAIASMTATDAGERETRAAVLVRDLAASVVALHTEVERATAAERARIAAWLRRKVMAGLTAGLPETHTLLALLSYADAIAANHTED